MLFLGASLVALGTFITPYMTTTWGLIFAIGVLMFAINVWRSRKHGEPAGPNPRDAPTLEWSTPSPPPSHNFAATPVVKRNPYDYSLKGEARPQNA